MTLAAIVIELLADMTIINVYGVEMLKDTAIYMLEK